VIPKSKIPALAGGGLQRRLQLDDAAQPNRPTPPRQARPRPATAQDRTEARAVARWVTARDPEPDELLCMLLCVSHAFPGIRLDTALAGCIFRKLLAKQPERRVLQ
jgi:hypothetical protein